MGHAHIDVTMEVYNHIGELTRIENEIARLDSMVLNAWHHKKRNWCQIGVKTEKITISKEIRYCKPLILKGLQKNNKNISTQVLTVLIMSVILRIEQKINGYLNIDKYPFVKEERVWTSTNLHRSPLRQSISVRRSPTIMDIKR